MGTYKAHLRTLGYRRLNSGADAEVFISKDRNHVLKIGYVHDNRAYIEYIKTSYSLSGRGNNPWLPRIYDIRECKPGDGVSMRYVVITMERLYGIHGKGFAGVAQKLSDAVDSRSTYAMTISDKLVAKTQQPGLYEAVTAIRTVMRDLDIHECDLHTNNIMARPVSGGVRKYECVITDPVHESCASRDVRI